MYISQKDIEYYSNYRLCEIESEVKHMQLVRVARSRPQRKHRYPLIVLLLSLMRGR